MGSSPTSDASLSPHGLVVRTLPFHGGSSGSNPDADTKFSRTEQEFAQVVKLVDALRLGRSAARRESSSLSLGTPTSGLLMYAPTLVLIINF